VVPEVRTFIRVCSYDRPSLGRSDLHLGNCVACPSDFLVNLA
jgi:hypothetical protein